MTLAVRLTRATRRHPRFRKGASVRAAVAMVVISSGLDGEDALRQAMEAAMTTRIDLRDDIDADMASALDELYEQVVVRGEDPDAAEDESGAGPKA